MYVRGAITNIPLSNNNLAAMHNKSTSVGALGSTEEIVKPLVESKTEEGPTAKVDPCPGGRLTNCGPSYRPTNSSILFMSLMTAPLGLGPARTPCVKAHNRSHACRYPNNWPTRLHPSCGPWSLCSSPFPATCPAMPLRQASWLWFDCRSWNSPVTWLQPLSAVGWKFPPFPRDPLGDTTFWVLRDRPADLQICTPAWTLKQPCDLVLSFLSHRPGPIMPAQVPTQWPVRSPPSTKGEPHPCAHLVTGPPSVVPEVDLCPSAIPTDQDQPHWVRSWGQLSLPRDQPEYTATQAPDNGPPTADPTANPVAAMWASSSPTQLQSQRQCHQP